MIFFFPLFSYLEMQWKPLCFLFWGGSYMRYQRQLYSMSFSIALRYFRLFFLFLYKIWLQLIKQGAYHPVESSFCFCFDIRLLAVDAYASWLLSFHFVGATQIMNTTSQLIFDWGTLRSRSYWICRYMLDQSRDIALHVYTSNVKYILCDFMIYWCGTSYNMLYDSYFIDTCRLKMES